MGIADTVEEGDTLGDRRGEMDKTLDLVKDGEAVEVREEVCEGVADGEVVSLREFPADLEQEAVNDCEPVAEEEK